MSSEIDFSILDQKRTKILHKIFKNFPEGYLAGGTALALQMKHRYSYDFDIFLSHEIEVSDANKLQSNFNISLTEVNNQDQLSIVDSDGIRISIIHYYFPLILPLIETGEIRLSSVKDIAADKAYTIGRRAVWRDYVDIFFILKYRVLSLNEIINLTNQKYKTLFNDVLFLSQLSYFEDLQITRIDYIKDHFSDDEIKNLLTKKVAEVQIK